MRVIIRRSPIGPESRASVRAIRGLALPEAACDGWRPNLFSRAGFHRLGSDFADSRIKEARERLARGETLYLAGLGLPGTHNSGVALVEVTQSAARG